MTDQLAFLHANTAVTELTEVKADAQRDRKTIKQHLANIAANFWSYTEKTGKSDASSYKGIL